MPRLYMADEELTSSKDESTSGSKSISWQRKQKRRIQNRIAQRNYRKGGTWRQVFNAYSGLQEDE